MNLYQVLIHPAAAAQSRYLFSDLAETHTLDTGEVVVQLTCTDIDTSGNFVELQVLEPATGIPRRLLLNHSYVVAILETLNRKNPPGFVRREEAPGQ